jgi:hypothetical protein
LKAAFKEENYKFIQIFIFKSMALWMISTYLITSHRFNHIKRPLKLIYCVRFYFYVNSKHIKLFFSNNFLLFFHQGIKIRSKYLLKKFFDVVQLLWIFHSFSINFLLLSIQALAKYKADLLQELYLFFCYLLETNWLIYYALSNIL